MHSRAKLLSDIASAILIQRRRIQNRAISTRDKLRRQMRAIVHCEQTPPIRHNDLS